MADGSRNLSLLDLLLLPLPIHLRIQRVFSTRHSSPNQQSFYSKPPRLPNYAPKALCHKEPCMQGTRLENLEPYLRYLVPYLQVLLLSSRFTEDQ